MKKRPIDDKQVLRSSAQLAEIFCFYPFTIEPDLIAAAKKIFCVFESGQPYSIFSRHNPLCLEVIHETLLSLSEGGESLLDEVHVLREDRGKLKRTKVPRTDLDEDKSIRFALTFHDHIQSSQHLSDETAQTAIFAIVHYWSEALRTQYSQMSPEAKKHIKSA